jgi:hypothetical protein
MPEPSPSSPAADRNLLFGILALQVDFITRDALIQVMNAWVLEKAKPLGQILVDQGVLRPDRRDVLENLVEAHLEAHGGHPAHSLAALSVRDTLRQDLEQVADPDLDASLARVPMALPVEAAPDPMRPPAAEDSHPTRYPAADSHPTGEPSVGAPTSAGLRFRILRPHAKGGLGQVSVALDEELNREVALKEIQERYADDPESRARFLLEAEITGGLEHPGIVPVHGLGTYPDGRPFYAMRLIRGDSFLEAIARFHCQDQANRDSGERTLALRELLGRFVDVCQAVAYAHSRGVLHRDLKPGNVMLGKFGETLLVDWGLAKPLGRVEGDTPSAEGPLQPASASGAAPTQMGTTIGTPAYMSPEQAAGQLDQLGPVADVYSLGATLYCLLTGRPPFQEKDLGVLLQQVQRGDFPRPRQVQPRVPAALEAVCLKAMAVRPADRYAGALALAEEVEHWLAGEPVTCYREPYPARMARWLRRHQALAASSVVLLLTATAGLAGGLYFVNAEKNRTEEARKGEAQAAADARAVLEFFQDQVLAAARPENQDGGLGIQATIREAVDAAEPKIAGAFQDRPLVESSIRNTLGTTYWHLGEDQAAIAQHERALALRRGHLGPDHPETLTSMNNLALVYKAAGQLDKALPLLEQVVAKFKQKLGPDHPDTLSSMNNLALAYQAASQLDKALPVLEQVLAKFEEKLGPDHPLTIKTMEHLAMAYKAAGQLDKAVPLLEQALLKQKEKLGPDHPDTLKTMNSLALAYQAVGQLDNAVSLLEEALAKQKEKLGPDHPETLTSMNNLALAYQAVGQLDKAVPLQEQTLAKRKEKLGPDHPDTLTSMNNLAFAYKEAGQLDKALPLDEEALAKRKEKLGADHPETLTSMNNLAFAYKEAGRLDKALPLYEQALAKLTEKLGPDHPDTLRTLNNLASAYHTAGQLDKALPLLEQVVAKFKQKLGPDHPYTLASMGNLGATYLALSQPDKALPLLHAFLAGQRNRLGRDDPRLATLQAVVGQRLLKHEQYAEAEAVLRECLRIRTEKQPDEWTTFNTQSMLGGSLAGQRKYAEAEPLLKQGYDGLKERAAKIPAESKTRLTEALDRLVQLNDAWGKPDEAARWRAELEKQPKPPEQPRAK